VTAGAILLCAGRGERLGAGIEKALADLAGRPLFTWSLATLARVEAIASIVVVGPPALRAAAGAAGARVSAWVAGGETRQASVASGLRALPAEATFVAVHDAARALVSTAVIERTLAGARAHGAAIAAVRLEDTLKRGEGTIEETVPRAGLWRAQTPQAFRRDWLEAAHARAAAVATDDAALVEALGHPVALVEGDPSNFKITTPADLRLAEAWIAAQGAPA